MRSRKFLLALVPVPVPVLILALSLAWASLGAPTALAKSTEELAAATRNSIVTLNTASRSGAADGGLGTGFAVSTNLIATSLHVINEGRAITVKLADGSTPAVIGIEAWDRFTDLAVVRVETSSLIPLILGDDRELHPGAEVVAVGNPLGLERSVVAGVLSARREVEGVEVLQVALPVEGGNSGGPLMDRDGRVVGIVNAKSALTRNLGFATPVTRLKPLLEHPNPMSYSRWLRVGELPAGTWENHLGGNWRQKGGRILVDGPGTGFGGRALLYRTQRADGPTYELSVRVRLNDEAGAAGLIFGGDGQDQHWGFYPTGGQLRLTEFAGPDVFSWRILGTKPVTTYRPGDWNLLRVQVEAGRLRCSVNDTLVYEQPWSGGFGARLGLAKFRDTEAQFRDFAAGTNAPSEPAWPAEVIAALGDARPPRWTETDLLPSLKTHLAAGRRELARRARELETEAARLRALSLRAHREQARDELVRLLAQPDAKVDLVQSALLLAWHDQPELDVAAYRAQFEQLGAELKARLPATATAAERLQALREYLFTEYGFHGSRHDYENPANSHLSEVLDDREGLPITLSIVFLELASRIGIPHMHGVPLPGHFIVRYAPPGEDAQLFDVFDGGRRLPHDEADALGSQAAGVPVRSEFLEPATKRAIVVRMLTNLAVFAERSGGQAAALPYQDLLVAVAGDVRAEARQRVERAQLRQRTGDLDGTREDLQWIVDHVPPGLEVDRVTELLERLKER